MSWLVATLAREGSTWLVAGTALLALGSLCVWLARVPVHRQRIAELTMVATLAWIGLALVPLPRLWVGRLFASGEHPLALPSSELVGSRTRPELLAAEPVSPVTIHWPGSIETEPASAREPERTAALPLGEVVARGYVGALALGALWVAFAVVCLWRVRGRARQAGPEVQSLVAASSIGQLERTPRVLIAKRGTRPFCAGLLRGVIVLPECLLDAGASKRLASVLHHEIAHLSRRDELGRLLMALALPVLWLHPLYWWLRRQAHLAAELIADDIAARRGDAASYARDMIDLAATLTLPRAPLLAAVPAFQSRSEFFRRMQMLLQREGHLAVSCSPLRRFCFATVALGVLLLASASVGASRLVAQERGVGSQGVSEEEKLHREYAALQAERAALQAELDKLRAEIGALRRNQVAVEPVSTVPSKYAQRKGGRQELAEQERETEALLERRLAPGRAPGTAEEPKPVDLAPAGRAIADYKRGYDFEMARSAFPSPMLRQALPDAVALVSTALDLEGEIAITESRLEQLRKLVDSGNAPREELIAQEIRLKTLARKRELVMTTLEAERKATKLSRQALDEASKDASPRERLELEAQRVRLDSRLKALSLPR